MDSKGIIYIFPVNGSGLQTSNIAAKTCHTAHESMPSMCTRCPLYAHLENVLIFAFHFHLFFLYFFCLFCFVFLLFLQLCVRIEKNPGLGFSISGGISGQGNPFKPSDMVRPDPACQPVTASPAFPQSCHGNCCSLLQCFCQSVPMRVCLWGSSWLGWFPFFFYFERKSKFIWHLRSRRGKKHDAWSDVLQNHCWSDTLIRKPDWDWEVVMLRFLLLIHLFQITVCLQGWQSSQTCTRRCILKICCYGRSKRCSISFISYFKAGCFSSGTQCCYCRCSTL